MTLQHPIVSPGWLVEHHSSVQVVDVRWSMDAGPKLDDYLAGHIPGAVFADLDRDLSDPPGLRGRHPLPSPERFAAVRAALGLATVPVVAYDDQSGAVAGRLWWMLDAIGHPCAVLDGGIQAWPGELETGPAASAPADDVAATPVAPVPWPADRFIEADQVEAAIADGSVLVDARSAERFDGRPNPIDARPGHIPGSVSRPWTANLGSDGRFLAPDVLREQLAALGIEPGRSIIASCGSGVTGCHDLLAARSVGIAGGRLYTGSWSEWSLDPDRPVATAPDPGRDEVDR